MTDNNLNKPRWYGRLAKVAAWTIGICMATVLIVEALLSTPIVTDAVTRISGRYIDGDISFGKVTMSIL